LFGNVLVEDKDGGDDYFREVERGFSVSAQYLYRAAKILRLGGRIEYQFKRHLIKKELPEISYLPLYATLEINPFKKAEGIYLKANIGYNVAFDVSPRNNAKTSGGLYYGLGAGYSFKNGVVLETLYESCDGTIENGGAKRGYAYTKLGASVGYRVKI